MKRLLLLWLLLSASLSFAQSGWRYDSFAFYNSSGYARIIPYGRITVCANDATPGTATTSCMPGTQVYGDASLTDALPAPTFLGDVDGNFFFYVPAGLYRISVCSPQSGLCKNLTDVSIGFTGAGVGGDCSIFYMSMVTLYPDGTVDCDYNYITFQHNGLFAGQEYVANFVDSDGGAWILTDDALNNRLNVELAQPVDVGVTYNGTPTAALVLVRHPFPFAVTIPAGCAHSHLVAETAATSDAALTLQKCTTASGCADFGTLTFGGVAAWDNGATYNFGDVVSYGSKAYRCTTTTCAAGNQSDAHPEMWAVTFPSGSFSCALTTFAEGDVLKVLAPASPDASLAALGGAIYGTRGQ